MQQLQPPVPPQKAVERVLAVVTQQWDAEVAIANDQAANAAQMPTHLDLVKKIRSQLGARKELLGLRCSSNAPWMAFHNHAPRRCG